MHPLPSPTLNHHRFSGTGSQPGLFCAGFITFVTLYDRSRCGRCLPGNSVFPPATSS